MSADRRLWRGVDNAGLVGFTKTTIMEGIIVRLRRLFHSSRSPAYDAGFQAGPGRLCPYRDPKDVEQWYAGRADHETALDQAW